MRKLLVAGSNFPSILLILRSSIFLSLKRNLTQTLVTGVYLHYLLLFYMNCLYKQNTHATNLQWKCLFFVSESPGFLTRELIRIRTRRFFKIMKFISHKHWTNNKMQQPPVTKIPNCSTSLFFYRNIIGCFFSKFSIPPAFHCISEHFLVGTTNLLAAGCPSSTSWSL